MRYMLKYHIFLLMIFVCCWGCAADRIQPQMAEEQIERADAYLNTVRSLGAEAGYAEDFSAASGRLADARLAKNPEGAYLAAEESVSASRIILTKYYHDTVAKLAKLARATLEQLSIHDPEEPLAENIPDVDRIAAYAEALDKDQTIVSVSRVLKDLNQVLTITSGIRTKWNKTLVSDTTFQRGKYELSDTGRNELAIFVREICDNTRQAYPDMSVRMGIRVVGYTDRLNFGIGTKLVKKLSRGIEKKIPQKEPERRLFLNQLLSEFRSRQIGNYVRKMIKDICMTNIDVTVEIIGRGEEIPSPLPPPYPISDARRRICKLYIHTMPK